MALYRYSGRSEVGDRVEGVLEGASADAVASQLLNSGITPLSVEESIPRRDALADLRRLLGRRTPRIEDLILFCRQMYSLLHAGVPIIRAIHGLRETGSSRALVGALKEVANDLESGRDLSGAMARHPRVFSTLFVSMVQVGESTGQLDDVFLSLARYLELEKETRDRIRAALRYPVFVLVAIAVAVAIINVFVVPEFSRVFRSFNAELPWATRVLIHTSAFSVAYWPYILGGTVLAVFGLRAYVNTQDGRYRWDRLKLRLPMVGDIIDRATLGRYARAFAMTSRAGVPLLQTLTVVGRAVDNAYVDQRIGQMRQGVERGESLTRTAAASGLFTPLVMQMLAVGEETGAIDALMQEVAEFYEREVEYDIRNLSSAIEPLLIVVIGVLVLILALGIFLPMWELSSVARGGR